MTGSSQPLDSSAKQPPSFKIEEGKILYKGKKYNIIATHGGKRLDLTKENLDIIAPLITEALKATHKDFDNLQGVTIEPNKIFIPNDQPRTIQTEALFDALNQIAQKVDEVARKRLKPPPREEEQTEVPLERRRHRRRATPDEIRLETEELPLVSTGSDVDE